MVTDHRLEQYRATWNAKPVLQAIYRDYFRRIAAACISGRTLEIGGGPGNLKSVVRQVISTDVLSASWLDAVADAQSLPFCDGSFSNIVMVDVLHHLPCPRSFLAEAQRLLKPGGRLVLLEPAITPLSWLFYHYLHREAVDLSEDPLAQRRAEGPRDPFHANQAIPTLMFGRHRRRFEQEFPLFSRERIEKLSLLAYPLCGGYRPWSALPVWLAPVLLWLEDIVKPVLGPLIAFRLFVVLVRK